jgi:hypothetical protein
VVSLTQDVSPWSVSRKVECSEQLDHFARMATCASPMCRLQNITLVALSRWPTYLNRERLPTNVSVWKISREDGAVYVVE